MPSTVAPETASTSHGSTSSSTRRSCRCRAADDNERFFDHRRNGRAPISEGGGLPRREWEELLAEMKSRADRAGFLRHDLPVSVGGDASSNLEMAIIREHLAHRGLGLQ